MKLAHSTYLTVSALKLHRLAEQGKLIVIKHTLYGDVIDLGDRVAGMGQLVG